LAHFDYVTFDDLENIGMGKPVARRLLDAVKKRKTKIRNKNLVNKILPPSISQQKSSKVPSSSGAIKKNRGLFESQGVGSALTCLIQEKVLSIGVTYCLYHNQYCIGFLLPNTGLGTGK
jgi:activated CDC42 kinase 1